MPSGTKPASLEELEQATTEATRLLDLALILRRAKTGEPLLRAGGVWDRVARRFRLRPDGQREKPKSVHIIDLEESQVEFTRWFATFLADYRAGRPRAVSLALVSGDRRGGKTFDSYFCQIAALIDVPAIPSGLPTIGWSISRTYRHRDELDQLIANYIPKAWYSAQRAPEHRYTFVHGSQLAMKIDPEGAEADADGVWKPWGDRAYSNWDGRLIERGGLVGAPPRTSWTSPRSSRAASSVAPSRS